MAPSRIAPATIALVVIAFLTSCSREDMVAGTALSLALRQAYPDTRFDVGFRASASHLVLTVDDSLTRAVSDRSALERRGRSFAQAVLETYEHSAELDSITVMLVREGEREFLTGSFSAYAETFAVSDLR